MSISEGNTHKAVGRLAFWTTKLLKSEIMKEIMHKDATLFSSAYAALQPFYPKLIPTKSVSIDSETRKEINANAKDLERKYGADFTSNYNKLDFRGRMLFEEYNISDDWTKWDEFLTKANKEAESLYKNIHTSIEQNIDLVGDILQLNDIERDILEFQVLRTELAFDIFYMRLFEYSRKNRYFLTAIFNIIFDSFQIGDLSKTSILSRSGLVSYNPVNGYLSKMSTSLANLFFAYENGTPEHFFAQIVKKMEKKPSASGALGNLSDLDEDLVIKLFNKTSKQNNYNEEIKGVNILTYGSHTLDKKTAAYNVLKDNDFDVYSLVTKGIASSDLAPRAFIAQRFLAAGDILQFAKKPALIIEQAENVLARRAGGLMSFFGGFAEKDDSEELLENDEALLEENPIPTLWVVDSPEELIVENVGRFLYHCEIKPASRADRKKQIENVIDDLDLSDEVKLHLSKYHQLSHKQVVSAATLAKIVGVTKVEQEDILKRGIHHSQRALGRGAMEELRESVTSYSLDYINLASEFKLEQVIEALKKNPHGTLCFWGIPGSGKTMFAEYLALQLDLPIIMKKASDLLSKWVGDNEKNIAAMFQEAHEEGAILFLDEADSFLRDRSEAKDNWSVSLTNELLQGMERFPGIFICATNLFKKIDPASLRRFTFKFEFKEMTEEQRWKMFQVETGLDDLKLPSEEIYDLKKRIEQIRNLAPGDFATVKRQSNILGSVLTPQQWVNQLVEESQAKLEGIESRKIGFGGE